MAKFRTVMVCRRCCANGKTSKVAQDDDGDYCVECGDADSLVPVKERVSREQQFEEIEKE